MISRCHCTFLTANWQHLVSRGCRAASWFPQIHVWLLECPCPQAGYLESLSSAHWPEGGAGASRHVCCRIRTVLLIHIWHYCWRLYPYSWLILRCSVSERTMETRKKIERKWKDGLKNWCQRRRENVTLMKAKRGRSTGNKFLSGSPPLVQISFSFTVVCRLLSPTLPSGSRWANDVYLTMLLGLCSIISVSRGKKRCIIIRCLWKWSLFRTLLSLFSTTAFCDLLFQLSACLPSFLPCFPSFLLFPSRIPSFVRLFVPSFLPSFLSCSSFSLRSFSILFSY